MVVDRADDVRGAVGAIRAVHVDAERAFGIAVGSCDIRPGQARDMGASGQQDQFGVSCDVRTGQVRDLRSSQSRHLGARAGHQQFGRVCDVGSCQGCDCRASCHQGRDLRTGDLRSRGQERVPITRAEDLRAGGRAAELADRDDQAG